MIPDPTVKPLKTGSDCTYAFPGVFIGTNTVAQAMANAGRQEAATVERIAPSGRAYMVPNARWVADPITKVHSIDEQHRLFLIVSWACIQVQGE